MVSSTERLLLHDCGPGLRDHCSSRATSYDARDAFPNAAAHSAAHTTANPTGHAWRSC